MSTKNIFGYLFLILAVILGFALLGQISQFMIAMRAMFDLFNQNLDDYQKGKVVGSFIYWILHLTAVILLWIFGRKFIRKGEKSIEDSENK